MRMDGGGASDSLGVGARRAPSSFAYLDRGGRLRKFGRMDGGQQTMPNASMGLGAIRVEVSGTTDTVRILMFATELSGAVTGVNLHLARPGHDGPIALDLTSNLVQVGPDSVILIHQFDASELQGTLAAQPDPIGDFMAELATGGVYLNLHTTTFPAGEVRGQL